MDDKEKIEKLELIIRRLDASGIYEFVELSQKTWKIMWMNFVAGIARGLGFTVGTAIVLAIVYKIISHLISLNIPYLTEMRQRPEWLPANSRCLYADSRHVRRYR